MNRIASVGSFKSFEFRFSYGTCNKATEPACSTG